MGKKGYQATRHLRERAAHKRGGQEPTPLPPGEAGSMIHYLERYLEHLAIKHRTPGTIIDKGDLLKTFLLWAQERGLTQPQEITKPILESYQRHLYRYRKANGKPLGISTQCKRLGILRSYFAWLTKQDILPANPASELELPRPEKRLPSESLSLPQVRALLNIPDITDPLGLRDRTMLELFYSTGIRRAELIKLELHDLNEDRRTVRVRQGKNRKDRVVPLGTRALAWITRYLEEVRPKLLLDPGERHLFLTSYGGPFAPNVLSRMVTKWIKQADIARPGSCHLMRHTCATHMLEGGADIRYIQQLLGHENLETTAIYTQVSIEQLKAVHALTHPAENPQDKTCF